MAVLFFLFWVVLNGRITAEIAVFGLVISAALYVFMCKVLDWRPRYDLLLVRSLPLAGLYLRRCCGRSSFPASPWRGTCLTAGISPSRC